jgi:hypothetical protein
MTPTDQGWYRRNLRSLRTLTEPVLDQMCEWLHQRYIVDPGGNFDGWCPGWRYFAARAPSLRGGDFRPWKDFLRPVPGWRSVRNAEPGESGRHDTIAGPELTVTIVDDASTAGAMRYRVEMGEVFGPMAGQGGELEVTVGADGAVDCRATGGCWIA